MFIHVFIYMNDCMIHIPLFTLQNKINRLRPTFLDRLQLLRQAQLYWIKRQFYVGGKDCHTQDPCGGLHEVIMIQPLFFPNYTGNQCKSLMAKCHQHSVFVPYGTTLATFFSLTLLFQYVQHVLKCIKITLFSQ